MMGREIAADARRLLEEVGAEVARLGRLANAGRPVDVLSVAALGALLGGLTAAEAAAEQLEARETLRHEGRADHGQA